MLAVLIASLSLAAIPNWTIMETSPFDPPSNGYCFVFKGPIQYYVGLNPNYNTMLYEYNYWSETSTPVPGTEGIQWVSDVSDKYVVHHSTTGSRQDILLFDGTNHKVILPYDEKNWVQCVRVSGEYVVWQQEGGPLGNGIFLYNIAAGTIIQIDDKEYTSQAEIPDIDYPYVVWEEWFSSDYPPDPALVDQNIIMVYNIQTGLKTSTYQDLPDCDRLMDQFCSVSFPYLVFERGKMRYDDDLGRYVTFERSLMVADLRSMAITPLSLGGGFNNGLTSEGNAIWTEYSAAAQQRYLYFWDGTQTVIVPSPGDVQTARIYGPNLLFYAKDNGVYRYYVALADADTDGDGLLDSWETDGLDIDQDGTIDLDLPALGADPDHKDLFVEVDRMAGVPFRQSSLDMVRTAFANAPVNNPDGLRGIDLHIQVDDVIPFQNTIDDNFTAFGVIKDLYWGTAWERTHPTNADNILNAKKRAFRYCLFANRFPSGAVGRGERPGNDFAVAMGAAHIQTEHEMAVTFMHELGHNLGLDEGGGDNILFKPNHVSVMNYGFAEFQEDWTGDLLTPDYSREAMLPLDESNLDETVGIVSQKTPDVWSFFGLTDPNGVHQGIDRMLLNSQPCDWNGNFDMTETAVVMDLTWLYPNDPNHFPPTPGQILNGHDDWANLQLPIGATGAFADRVIADLEPTPMTVEVRKWLRDNVPHIPMLSDLDDNRRIDFADFAAFADYWRRTDCDDCGKADFTDDSSVTLPDLAVFAQRWLKATD
jgi:hypothetical protein